MKRWVVQSPGASSIGYDASSRVLEVEFHRGAVYRYFDVPSSVYDELMAVDAISTFLNAAIKPHYRCERVAAH